MEKQRKVMFRRRDMLLAVTATGVATAMGAAAIPLAAADPVARRDKRKAQYQPNSAEVQTFYRVNRYPAK